MSSTLAPAPAESASQCPSKRERLRLGWLAPAGLAVWLALDLGLRLLPVERLGVSPITAAQRFTGRHSPFRANVSIRIAAGSPGENAVRGNLPPTERRPPLRFSTDALGYRRNPEVAAGTAPDVLFIGGDSFIYGANLSDEETLPAAFTRASGLLAYNGGRSHLTPLTLDDLDWLLSHLPGLPRQVVLVHLEQHRRRVSKRGLDAAPSALQNLKYARFVVNGWWDASPLSNATRRLFRRLADDKILPNVYEQDVIAYKLPDGRPMLFRASETFPARKPQAGAALDGTAEYIVQWARELEARGLETHVLVLPTRFTVYGPLLESGELRTGALRAASDLDSLEVRLRRKGIRTTNGLRVFQQTAATDLAAGALPFYREDNHWTPEGVERIARILTDSLSYTRLQVQNAKPLAEAASSRNR